jgi:hypothetical protein
LYVFTVNTGPVADNTPQDTQPANRNAVRPRPAVSNWHSLVVHIKDGQIAVWDPSDVAKAQDSQLSMLGNMKTVMPFVKALKGSRLEEWA